MDREKVVKGLEHCFHGQECCGDTECPYYIEHLSDSCCLEDCQENLKADALAMLKDQKQSKAIKGQDNNGKTMYTCEFCHAIVKKSQNHYCSHCGREMLWQ